MPTMNEISILRIVEDTTVDGPGFRTTIYAAGCPHHCLGCHNPQSWKKRNGTFMRVSDILQIILADPFADVTFSGGEPFAQVKEFTALAQAIKESSTKNIWCYTGYTLEEIMVSPYLSQLLPYIDVLVDGKFEEELYDESLLFRGSKNQRIIDIPKTLQCGEITLIDLDKTRRDLF